MHGTIDIYIYLNNKHVRRYGTVNTNVRYVIDRQQILAMQGS